MLTVQEIETAIEKILWGKSIVRVEDEQGRVLTFVLRSLTSQEINYINYVHDIELAKAIDAGALSDEALSLLYEEKGIWTEEDEIYDRGLRRKIEILRSKIKAHEFFTLKKKQFKKKLRETEDELEERAESKNRLFSMSAECRAEEIKRRYVIMMAAETLDGEPHWQTEQDFLKEIDGVLIYNLAVAYYENNFFDQKTIREVARSAQWRYRWGASKNADLFGKPIAEWSEMQNAICYWSQYYDSIYNSPDRPTDSIINDDDACDAWVQEQNKKALAQTRSNDRNILGTKKAKTTKDHQEEFVFVQPGDKEAIDKVQNMNTDSDREKLRRKFEAIKGKKGRTKEWDLHKKGLA